MTNDSFTTGGTSRLHKEEAQWHVGNRARRKKSLQASLERLKVRIQGKKQEIKELQTQTAQVEQAIKALG